MTISLIATAAIVVIGALVIWLFVVPTPRPVPEAPAPTTEEPAKEPDLPLDGALNLYMTAPETLPAGAARVEMTLIKATLVSGDGKEAAIFEGSQRLTLQHGVTEKLLSDRIPNTRWTKLKLLFSPTADLAYTDGRPNDTALVERREAVLAFDADVPVSRTLALFAHAPLLADSGRAGNVTTLNVAAEPVSAEQYVFGAFLLDPRGRGGLRSVPSPSLASVVKADTGFDITRALSGSQGFTPAEDAPGP